MQKLTSEEKIVVMRILLSAQESFYSAPEAYAENESEETAFESAVSKLKDGCKMKNGLVTKPNGTKKWYLNGKLHRDDGPAIERANGTKKWCLNGKLHRTDGPAIEHVDGTRLWFLNGNLHRTDGPAIEWTDGSKEWYLNGKLHREDGPAVERANGFKEWYLNDKRTQPPED